MTEMFINPEALFAAVAKSQGTTATLVGSGPIAPQQDESVEIPTPVVSFPIPELPAPAVEPHYTQVLDVLWAEFDEPEERTAARLDSLLAETIDEAQRILSHKAQIWETMPAYKLPETERKRFDKEFSDYLARLNAYRTHLSELTPASLDTDAVYLGLVRRRDGAGPVPDAIMPIYFAKQLGILEDHAADMSEGFVARVMAALDVADDAIEGAAEAFEEAKEESSEKLQDIISGASGQVRDGLKTAGKWIAGAIAGTLLVGGAITAAVVVSRQSKESDA